MESKIKRITIVTQQGVNTYCADKNTAIKTGYYRIAGDPYPCFHVIKKNAMAVEIRCTHNLEIEYFESEK